MSKIKLFANTVWELTACGLRAGTKWRVGRLGALCTI